MLIREMAPGDIEEAELLSEFMRPPENADAGGGGISVPIQPAQNEAPAPEPEPIVQSKVPEIVVHLASYESRKAAVEGWEQLRQVHGDLLGRLNYGIAVVDLGEQGTFYRLLAGPFETKTLAASLCAGLKVRNIFCATSF